MRHSLKADGLIRLITGSQGNIGELETAEGLIELAIDTYGGLDILCNNTAVMDYMQGAGELADDVWQGGLRCPENPRNS